MTELQINTLKDALEVLKKPIFIAYDCANPDNDDANLWADVLQTLYETKAYIEDALNHEEN